MYYVHVIGPYDNTFVGSFSTIDAAANYLRSIDRETFSAYILTEADFNANTAEFGAVKVQTCQ